MPGQPFERETERVIEKAHGGVDALYRRLAAGETLAAIARTISVRDPRTGVPRAPDRATVRRVLNNSEERRAKYGGARKESAEADVDTAREKLENAPETREGIAKAREVAAHLRWEAAKKDREQFSDPGPSVNVNVAGTQFLQAIARPSTLKPPARRELAPAVDAEVEELPATVPKAPKLIAEIERSARIRARENEILKLGYSIVEAQRLAVQLEHAETPAVNETIPGRPRLKPPDEELDE